MTSKMDKYYWFWIEPYVHIFLKNKSVLLYDTLSGKKLEYSNRPEIIALVKKLLIKKNLSIVKLREDEIKRPPVDLFIKDTRENFMGDLIDISLSGRKPVQFVPAVHVQSDVKKTKKEFFITGKNILTFLFEIDLYINDRCGFDAAEVHRLHALELHKQFLFPVFSVNGAQRELELSVVEKLLEQIRVSGIYKINISGGNIFTHSQFDRFLDLFNRFPAVKTYHIYYKNLLSGSSAVESIADEYSDINIFLVFPLDEDKSERAIRLVKNREDATFTFAIADEKDIEVCRDMIARFELQKVNLKPYYNGKNLDFFKEIVFIDKDTILSANPSQKDIFSREVANKNFFGKLTVMSNGDIYSSANEPCVGNIKKDSIYDVMFNELYKRKTWFRVRPNVMPCKKCLYNLLCPPISNYEIILRRNNLCHIES